MVDWLKIVKTIPDNALIIARPVDKIHLLNAIHLDGSLFCPKFIDEQDLLIQTSDEYYLQMKNLYGFSFYQAKKMFPFFNYVNTVPENSSLAIRKLAELRSKLIREGVLIQPDLAYYKTHPLFAINRSRVSSLVEQMGCSQIQPFELSNNPIEIVACENQETQIHAVIEHIANWLQTGLSIDDILIVNAKDADKGKLMIEADQYGFEITEQKSVRMDRFPLVLSVLKKMQKQSLSDILKELIDKKDSLQPLNIDVLSALTALVGEYGSDILEKQQELLRFELANRYISILAKSHAVKMIEPMEVYPSEDLHYIVMNYTDNDLLLMKKDLDYLSDQEKISLSIRPSYEENQLYQKELESLFASLPHLTGFYSVKKDGQENKKADLNINRKIEENQYKVSADPISHSSRYDAVLYAKRRYEWQQFGVLTADLPLLEATFSNRWHLFDPQFTKLSDKTINALIQKKVTLSATSLTQFYECRFKYFLNYLLKISPKEESLDLSLGNLTHYIVSFALSTSKSVKELAGEYLEKDLFLTKDERTKTITDLFVSRLEIVMEYLSAQQESSQFAVFSCEKTYQYLHPDDTRFVVFGKIDRVMTYLYQDHPYVAVIDYKTGTKTFVDEDFKKGIDIQLVFYLHLLEKAGVFSAMKVAGFYYQPMNLAKYAKSDTKDPIKDKLKLEGRTLKNPAIVSAFDREDSIRGVAYKNDGDFKTNSHLVEEETMNGYLSSIQLMVNSAVKSIQNGDFFIQPLPVAPNQKKSQSCEYCSFQGVCYSADTVTIDEIAPETEGDE